MCGHHLERSRIMKSILATIAALALPLFFVLGTAQAQLRVAEAEAVAPAADLEAMCVVPDDGDSMQLSVKGADYTCFPNDIGAERAITNCYCGQYNGSALYVGVDCAGYSGHHTCCADKCGVLTAALDAQE